MGKPEAIEDHPGHGFARCDHGLCIRDETRVDHLKQLYVFDDRCHHPYMIQAFDGYRFQAAVLP
jgi:hypothetical protein